MPDDPHQLKRGEVRLAAYQVVNALSFAHSGSRGVLNVDGVSIECEVAAHVGSGMPVVTLKGPGDQHGTSFVFVTEELAHELARIYLRLAPNERGVFPVDAPKA